MIDLPNYAKYSQKYLDAVPFPHVVIDNFLTADVASKIETSISNLPSDCWQRMDHAAQRNKLWLSDIQKMPEEVKQVVEFFHSKPSLEWLQKVTRIPELHPDPELLGGGIHCTLEHGQLGIHTDFNWHPTLKKHRRLNLLLFLSEKWSAADGGVLEFWHRDMTSPVVSYVPEAGRLVLFATSEHSYHGHPMPVASGRKRLSISLYFYADTPPEGELLPPHWASWKRRPGETMF